MQEAKDPGNGVFSFSLMNNFWKFFPYMGKMYEKNNL